MSTGFCPDLQNTNFIVVLGQFVRLYLCNLGVVIKMEVQWNDWGFVLAILTIVWLIISYKYAPGIEQGYALKHDVESKRWRVVVTTMVIFVLGMFSANFFAWDAIYDTIDRSKPTSLSYSYAASELGLNPAQTYPIDIGNDTTMAQDGFFASSGSLAGSTMSVSFTTRKDDEPIMYTLGIPISKIAFEVKPVDTARATMLFTEGTSKKLGVESHYHYGCRGVLVNAFLVRQCEVIDLTVLSEDTLKGGLDPIVNAGLKSMVIELNQEQYNALLGIA